MSTKGLHIVNGVWFCEVCGDRAEERPLFTSTVLVCPRDCDPMGYLKELRQHAKTISFSFDQCWFESKQMAEEIRRHVPKVRVDTQLMPDGYLTADALDDYLVRLCPNSHVSHHIGTLRIHVPAELVAEVYSELRMYLSAAISLDVQPLDA